MKATHQPGGFRVPRKENNMSNNTEKAEALRKYADLIESGKVPVGEASDQPIHTHIGYGSAEEVDRASEVFVAAGATLRLGGMNDEITVAQFWSGDYYPTLEVSLYDWSDSDE